eukprot:6667132-Prymnesium_polylepis.1
MHPTAPPPGGRPTEYSSGLNSMSPSNAALSGAAPTQPTLEEAAAGAGVLPAAGLSDPASLAAAGE